MRDPRDSRTWFRDDRPEPDVRLFLVQTPLTFGHSQLIMKFPPRSDESTRFLRAADFIQKALVSFKQVLSPKILKEFKVLAEHTLTNGTYIKTLVLRTSAHEEKNEYKVHLVPYFRSHARACQKRYTAIHKVDPKEQGGLIGWLGERETIVDNWQIKGDNPFDGDLDEIANKKWKLSRLAKRLSQAWPC